MKENARQLREKKKFNPVAHEQQLNIARAHGAGPGQLSEVASEDPAGNLSLSQRDGALSISKKQPE